MYAQICKLFVLSATQEVSRLVAAAVGCILRTIMLSVLRIYEEEFGFFLLFSLAESKVSMEYSSGIPSDFFFYTGEIARINAKYRRAISVSIALATTSGLLAGGNSFTNVRLREFQADRLGVCSRRA